MPLALFALAFAGALFVLREPGAAGDAGPPAAASAVPWADAASASSAPASDTASPQAGGQRAANAATEPRAVAAPPESDGPARESAIPPDAQPAVEAVGDAIDTLESSASPDDRVRAIRSLAATARSGLDVPRVRSSLRVAAADDDPDVAARAQDEYDALLEREDR